MRICLESIEEVIISRSVDSIQRNVSQLIVPGSVDPTSIKIGVLFSNLENLSQNRSGGYSIDDTFS